MTFSLLMTQMPFPTNVMALVIKIGSEGVKHSLHNAFRVFISPDTGLNSCQQVDYAFLFQELNSMSSAPRSVCIWETWEDTDSVLSSGAMDTESKHLTTALFREPVCLCSESANPRQRKESTSYPPEIWNTNVSTVGQTEALGPFLMSFLKE